MPHPFGAIYFQNIHRNQNGEKAMTLTKQPYYQACNELHSRKEKDQAITSTNKIVVQSTDIIQYGTHFTI